MIYFEGVSIKANSAEYLNSIEEQAQGNEQREFLNAIFGADLSILGTDDIFVKESRSKGGDLLITSGVGNLGQAIHHRLITERGSLPEDPTIGIPWLDFLGKTYADKDFIYAQLADIISTELVKDTRIANVPNVQLEFVTPNVLNVYIEIQATSGESLTTELTVVNN